MCRYVCCWVGDVLVQVGYARSLCKSRTSSSKLSKSCSTFSLGKPKYSRASLPHGGRLAAREAGATRAKTLRIRAHSSLRQLRLASICVRRLRFHHSDLIPLTFQEISQDGMLQLSLRAQYATPQISIIRHLRPYENTTSCQNNTILTMPSSTNRSVTPPPKSSRPSPPALAVPTSVFLSRTPARPLRPSTAGRSPVPSSTSRTSRATSRPSP
jgi:hypothetical protein